MGQTVIWLVTVMWVLVFFLCRNLLELAQTNFNNLETEACPTWRGKLRGALLACSQRSGEVLSCLCPGAMGKAQLLSSPAQELKHMFNGKRLRHSLVSV